MSRAPGPLLHASLFLLKFRFLARGLNSSVWLYAKTVLLFVYDLSPGPSTQALYRLLLLSWLCLSRVVVVLVVIVVVGRGREDQLLNSLVNSCHVLSSWLMNGTISFSIAYPVLRDPNSHVLLRRQNTYCEEFGSCARNPLKAYIELIFFRGGSFLSGIREASVERARSFPPPPQGLLDRRVFVKRCLWLDDVSLTMRSIDRTNE